MNGDAAALLHEGRETRANNKKQIQIGNFMRCGNLCASIEDSAPHKLCMKFFVVDFPSNAIRMNVNMNMINVPSGYARIWKSIIKINKKKKKQTQR